jgi:hypothetical protein
MICAGVFIIFLVAMFSVSSYCFAEGDVAKYLAPVDAKLNICGYDKMKGLDYLNFTDLANPWTNPECVKECDKCSHSVAKYCVPYMSGAKECKSTKSDITAF